MFNEMMNMIKQKQSQQTSHRDGVLLTVGFSLRSNAVPYGVPHSRSEHSYVGSTLSVLCATNNRTNNHHPVRDVRLVEMNDTEANPACRRYATFRQSGRIPNGMRDFTVRINSTNIASLTGWGENTMATVSFYSTPYYTTSYYTVALGYCLHGCARYASSAHTPYTVKIPPPAPASGGYHPTPLTFNH
jgi:hypothetical protein